MSLKSTYSSIISYGTQKPYNNALNKRVRILNTFSIIWLHLVIFFVIVDLIEAIVTNYLENKTISLELFQIDSSSAQVITGFILLIIIFINKNHHFKIARTIFIIVAFINFSAFTLFIDPGKYIEYYFVFLSGMVLALYAKNTVPFIVMLVSYFIFLTPYYFYVVYPQEYIDRLVAPAAFCIFLCIFLLVNYFKKLNESNEKLLELERDKVISDKTILENQEAELRELNEFKSHFFVNLSHEIRTPLTLIQGYTSQINLEEPKNETLEKLKIITDQTEQMQSIIDSIMDLSNMDRKEFSLDKTGVSLSAFLIKHFSTFKPLFEKKQIDFQLINDLENTAILIDEKLFTKAINNLLSNALKFTEENGKVVLKAYQKNTALHIDVIDNGIGVPLEDQPYIFRRFYQAKNHITQSQGSGIGLAFTKSIVEEHNFSININNQPNGLTCFSIKIPETAILTIHNNALPLIELNQKITHNNNTPKLIEKSSMSSKAKILVVDDHPQMRNYLKNILNKYVITEAENGLEALKLLKTDAFDLILTDFMMPVMDGEALVSELKKQKNKTPIIVLTARTDNRGKLNMLRLGIDGYLHKPFLEEELLLQVKNGITLYQNLKASEVKLKPEEKESLDAFAEKFHQKITDYIIKNMTSPKLNVEDVANFMEVSKSTLNRKVRAILGQSVNLLILEARLDKARELRLNDPYRSKKSISDAVGFSNSSYLFNKLEERYGLINKN